MKKIVLLFLICTFSATGQEKDNEKDKRKVEEGIKLRPDIALTINTNTYFGDNYLAKGHKNIGVGAQIKTDWIHYKKFNLGIGFEKTSQKVTDFSLGGNISRTNANSIIGYFSYDLLKKSKFRVSPEVSYGGIELRQYGDGKYYGNQNGKRYGLGANLNYMIGNYSSFYANISYTAYALNVATTPEFKEYFDNAKSISISFGIKFH